MERGRTEEVAEVLRRHVDDAPGHERPDGLDALLQQAEVVVLALQHLHAGRDDLEGGRGGRGERGKRKGGVRAKGENKRKKERERKNRRHEGGGALPELAQRDDEVSTQQTAYNI